MDALLLMVGFVAYDGKRMIRTGDTVSEAVGENGLRRRY
jgi:hypothetical protein